MMDEPYKNITDMEKRLSDGREGIVLPDGLMARVIADAARVQSARRQTAPHQAASRSIWARVLWIASGSPVPLGGLLAAGVAGFWLGIAPPEGVPDAGALILGTSDVPDEEIGMALAGFGWNIEER